ncbi:cyclic nucleotide phosphodiesterase [Paraphaeosphaeria minitans]|uniref:Phosphodiesterase n=1 Tax=Paraphaeosphaeria minitans TaxID=565426 RepID=A0A9P6KQT7_9PLEO|nr:cyclic nucleotide phosphodiesterase [Paraphaeosphaeria minitans]
MEHGACNVIYIDRRANDEHVRRETLSSSLVARTSTGNVPQGYFPGPAKAPPPQVHTNVESILSIFNEVHVCGSGRSCLAKISQLLHATKESVPTVVLIDLPYDEEQRLKRLSREPRTPSPTATRLVRLDTGEPDDLYGMHLLTHISSEIASKNLSRLVIPVVVLSGLDREWASNALPSPSVHGSQVLTDTVRLVRYLDAGAVDVLSSPLSKDSVHGLVIHAYRVHKDVTREEASFLTTKRNRKLSWFGVSDQKPYAYLREAMVSNLMGGICNPETVGESLESKDIFVEEERKEIIAAAIGTWAFSAHDFTDDELLYGALLMLKHALKMPEVEEWGMTDDELTIFLLASRTAYNEFVLYHNFRHVIDVLQALFHFLVQIGTLPWYPTDTPRAQTVPESAIAQLLKPFDALTLLVSAIGHDVGHPGVNNAFLVALNAPLAQLYNDRSVLESFHCAAYSQILRRYWPKAFSDAAMRKLMINSILATDMGLHFKYMSDLGNLQEKLGHDKGVIDGWNVKVRQAHKDLACGLLIKCADISNVARKFQTAARWANILTDEFSNQGVMEQELEMPSCLFGGPPIQDDIIKLGESQIGFINIFARPLFEAVADILPAMRYAVDEILANKGIWEKKINDEKNKTKRHPNFSLGHLTPSFAADSTPSPLSGDMPVSKSPPSATLPTSQLGRTVQSSTWVVDSDDGGRRGSGGSFHGVLPSSRRSSGVDKGSQRSSGAGIAVVRSRENQSQSRRGSGDASLTAILVTQTSSAGDTPEKEPGQGPSGTSPSPSGHRKDTMSPKKGKDMRPVTAPSRRSQGKLTSSQDTLFYLAPRPVGTSPNIELGTNMFPVPHPSSQSHSEVDLSTTANGNYDGSKMQTWESNKLSNDSNNSRSDASRDIHRRSEWWRPARKQRDNRNGGSTTPKQQQAAMLDPAAANTMLDPSTSPGKSSRTGKLKSFFRRKSGRAADSDKQLSSHGSSSQLPTSDPGRSVNSDE